MHTRTPEEAAMATAADLMTGSLLHRVKMHDASHEKVFRDMLQERFDDIAAHQNLGGLLTCNVCNSSTNIMWEQRQTRSADEGMSVFAMCMRCNHKWVET